MIDLFFNDLVKQNLNQSILTTAIKLFFLNSEYDLPIDY
jgi:hypothetical protein